MYQNPTKFDPRDPDAIVIVWTLEDVVETAKNMELDLSDKQHRRIFQHLRASFDVGSGLGWDDITVSICECLAEFGISVPERR